MDNTNFFTSNKFQQAEQEKKRNWKHLQGKLISVNEAWYHILKYPEVITNLNFVIIQTTSLESITVNSLQNIDDSTNNNFTQYDANVTNNYKKVVIFQNELIQLLSTNSHFTEIQSTTHEYMQLYKTY